MRINVDDMAFSDPRFKLLGAELGTTWWEALGRCLPVWGLAYTRRSAVLRARDIDALAEHPGFAAALIAAELGMSDDGVDVYLCGVTDRIDFLLVQDSKRAKAKAARAAAAGIELPGGGSRGTSRGNTRVPGGGSRGRVPGDVPGEGPYSPDLDLAPDLAPERETRAPGGRPGGPSAPHVSDTRSSKLALDAWMLAGREFSKLQHAGVDADAPNSWGGLPSSSNRPFTALRALVAELLVEHRHDYASVATVLERRVLVAAAEADKKRTLEFMTPPRMWRRESFDIAAAMTPAQVARGRAPPRGSAERAPTVGRVMPVAPEEYQSGDIPP